jgi:DNA polymerase-3 subunit delta'
MRWYPWLRPSFDRLIARYQQGKGHHALLVHALAGMGDDALIYALSRWLMCSQPDGTKSCGRCHSCQLMQAGTHPDYRVLDPEKGKTSLGIDAVREVNEKIYAHARMGGAKVVWLPDAGQLTESAANALLKTLEEPAANSWFFLGCREPQRLPATLRSRCFYWHLPPPDENFAVGWLAREAQMPEDALRAALRLSAGAPAAALELLTSKLWAARLALCEKVSLAIAQNNWILLLNQLNHEPVEAPLRWLAALLLDAMKRRQGITCGLSNVDMLALVAALADTLAPSVLQAMATTLFRCREQLVTIPGLNRELLLTEMLLGWERYAQPGSVLPIPHL